jgi:hypothetical protein
MIGYVIFIGAIIAFFRLFLIGSEHSRDMFK